MPVMSGAPGQGGHISHQTTTFQPFKFSDVIQNKYFQSENNMEDILTENSEVHYKFQSLPHSVIAHGWIPFVVSDFILFFEENILFSSQVVTVLSLIFSVLYVIWYRSDRPHQRAHGTSTVAVLGEMKENVTEFILCFTFYRFIHQFVDLNPGSSRHFPGFLYEE